MGRLVQRNLMLWCVLGLLVASSLASEAVADEDSDQVSVAMSIAIRIGRSWQHGMLIVYFVVRTDYSTEEIRDVN